MLNDELYSLLKIINDHLYLLHIFLKCDEQIQVKDLRNLLILNLNNL